ncbi:unnamed protein product [Cladocopium goreaui]|uniref:Uncharacterized protein n=1 Tax=Cladocopium goreaui TaxID=2562237 RepID=A0A9P1DL85_9DINO|nr:unnamed protein product [Cladocopium goreaui]
MRFPVLVLGAGAVFSEALPVLPVELQCSFSSLSVEKPLAGNEAFTCPPYFQAKTCCRENELQQIWDKVEDMMQFILRVLDDHGEELRRAEEAEAANNFADGPCSAYHQQLFLSRLQGFRNARDATVKGLDILQGATMHMLCAACFQSSSNLKLEQVENFTSSALLSLQDRMGAIFTDQVIQDKSPDPVCSLRYVESLSEGVSFPAKGRFHPAFRWSGGMLDTFSNWMDRVLALLMEVPGSLMFQRSLLQLVFFYAERPTSDAFQLLLGPAPGGGELLEASEETEMQKLCPEAPRFIIFVRQAFPTEKLMKCHKDLKAVQTNKIFVLTNGSHAATMAQEADASTTILWRRFEVRNVDSFASALCGETTLRPLGWAAEIEELQCDESKRISRLLTAPEEEDLSSQSWKGMRPIRPISVVAWPPEGVSAYLQAHQEFVRRLERGQAEQKALVYVCTGMSYCGGHGDRLNGMLGGFVLALLSKRAFFIDSQRPVPLSLVLQPRKEGPDWRMYGSHAVLPAGFNFNDNLAAFEADPRLVLDSQEDVLRLVSNQRLTVAALKSYGQRAAALGLWQPRLHQHLFQMLFEPSPALASRLRQRDLPRGQRIGLHFRAGDQMPNHWKVWPRLGNLLEESMAY